MKKKLFVLVGLAFGLLAISAACGGGGEKQAPTATAPAPIATEASVPSSAELAAHFTTLKTVLQDTIAKAEAGDVQGTRDAEGQGDVPIEAIIDALRLVDPTLADQIETLELDYEEQADSDSPDLAIIAQAAQDVLDLLDQAAAALGVEGSAPTTGGDHGGEITFDAASATITVDGDSSDWDAIQGATVPLEQIKIPAGVEWDEPGPLDPMDVTLKVATDSDNVYVLLEIPDDYDFVADDHNLSPALAVMFLIDSEAGPHMGAVDEDLEVGLGMVDIWHWELDCAAGVLSGGGGITGGDDPNCNLDDEFATDPETREDDGGGTDIVNADAENSLAGVWEHTASASGAGADGTWIFEMSRPLQTGDPQDAQLVSGGAALMALAYFDPDETATGWTDTGHLQSAETGWIEVTLP